MKTRKEIEKKPGWAPYRKDTKWQKDLVAIRVPLMPQDGEAEVAVPAINGVRYIVPRGQDVKVPRLIAENLKTRMQHTWAMPGKNPMQGLQYVGSQSRFYVIELEGDKAAAAVEIKPAGPIAADQRVSLATAAMKARQEEAAAMAEARSAGVHEDLR